MRMLRSLKRKPVTPAEIRPYDSDRFVLDERSKPPKSELRHWDGVDWYQSPIPDPAHECVVQTYGYTNFFDYAERCACGAIRLSQTDPTWLWMERNSRTPR